jgi:hypothetical protein
MHAEVGDWLVVQSRSSDRHARRAVILGVGPSGLPPYTVRWSDDEHEAVVFPGPDAQIVSAASQAEQDRAGAARAERVQATILDREVHSGG